MARTLARLPTRTIRGFCLAMALQQTCSAGAQPVNADVQRADASPPAHVTFGDALDLEGNMVDYAALVEANRARATGDLPRLGPSRMPVASSQISSNFGMRLHPLLGILRMHSGVDLPVPAGSPVRATSAGIVGGAGPRGGYGLTIDILGQPGVVTRYAHLSRLNVAPGERVSKGQLLGWSGSTGLSTGPHLHYEVRLNGRPVNPLGRQAR